MTSLDTIGVQISKIEDSLSLIDSTVKFHLTIQWAVLAFVITAAGGALYVMARHWFEKGLEIRLEKRMLMIKKELLEDFEKKIPKVKSLTFTIGGTVHGNNAVRVQVENNNADVNSQVFIQSNGNHGDLEVYKIKNTSDYIVINKKPYFLSFNVLIVNGSIKLGRVPSYTEEEAMKIINA
ncbi:hypothetical protein AEA09_07305 [Lysinibacillus contaminans]|uniref:Uncharacterized protein n=1 Tax=Lysinibacillus contaminans TaxID=1293441 RepID=A0ABR5K0K4_9BACI|nr:hypothetical protein [Lysinibacillus contaminans]KOS68381.1 hypothetical protein AEA09_07305 [Lysinibacillus contaminans]